MTEEPKELVCPDCKNPLHMVVKEEEGKEKPVFLCGTHKCKSYYNYTGREFTKEEILKNSRGS
jgi:hypothetical protein